MLHSISLAVPFTWSPALRCPPHSLPSGSGIWVTSVSSCARSYSFSSTSAESVCVRACVCVCVRCLLPHNLISQSKAPGKHPAENRLSSKVASLPLALTFSHCGRKPEARLWCGKFPGRQWTKSFGRERRRFSWSEMPASPCGPRPPPPGPSCSARLKASALFFSLFLFYPSKSVVSAETPSPVSPGYIAANQIPHTASMLDQREREREIKPSHTVNLCVIL